jgi:ribonuclease HI
MEYMIHTDGGSRGNPGPSSCAAVLTRRMSPDHKWEKAGTTASYLGDKLTNNHAEYHGLLLGLEFAVRQGAKNCKLFVKSDSELMVKQMKGEYKFKNLDLLKIAEAVFLGAAINGIILDFQHVRRELNQEADRLCNIEMDNHKIVKEFSSNLKSMGA